MGHCLDPLIIYVTNVGIVIIMVKLLLLLLSYLLLGFITADRNKIEIKIAK
jgi:hypothetical protein